MHFETKSYGNVQVEKNPYRHGGQAAMKLIADDGAVVAVLTVNIPEFPLQPGEFLVKTWGENAAIAADALASGLFVDTGVRLPVGRVEAQLWRFAEKEE